MDWARWHPWAIRGGSACAQIERSCSTGARRRCPWMGSSLSTRRCRTGLTPADLHEGRDLKPTTDLRAVLKGLLRDHLRLDEAALGSSVFLESTAVAPMAGLVG